MADSKILKKLTIREFIGKKSEILAIAMTGRPKGKDSKGADIFIGTAGEPVKVMRVLGQCTGFKADESDNGPYVQLSGQFVATNMITGEQVATARAILPDAIGEQVAGAVKGGAEAVDFAVEIYVEFDEAAATMYKFSAKSLMEMAVPKPIQSLEAKLLAAGVVLSAPLKLAAPVLSDEDKAKQAEAEKKADEAQKAKQAEKDAGAATGTDAKKGGSKK